MGIGQLFEIKPRCCEGSLLRDELGSRRFDTPTDLTRSFPRVPAGALGSLGSLNLAQTGRLFGENLWPPAIKRMLMRITHKPVALTWRQHASAALRARAAATLPPAFMNNSHDFGTYKHAKDLERFKQFYSHRFAAAKATGLRQQLGQCVLTATSLPPHPGNLRRSQISGHIII